jgi:hypothetical protein
MIGRRLTQAEAKRLLSKLSQKNLADLTISLRIFPWSTYGSAQGTRPNVRPSEKYPEKHQTHGGESEYRPDKQQVLVNRQLSRY